MRRRKGDGTLLKRNKRWNLVFKADGKQFWKSLKTGDKAEAKRRARTLLARRIVVIERQLAKIEEKKKGRLKLGDVWDAFIASRRRPDSGEKTLASYESKWRLLRLWLAERHPSLEFIDEVKESIAEEYLGHIWKEGASGNTYNKHIQALKLMFNALRIDPNPFEGIKRARMEMESRNALTKEELARVFATLRNPALGMMHQAELEILFHVGVYTGLRLADSATLKWHDVDMAAGIISVKPRKTAKSTGSYVRLPIHPQLKDALCKAEAWKDESGYVMPNVARRYGYNYCGISQDCTWILAKAGIKTTEAAKEGSRRKTGICRYSFHSLRHTFVSLAAEAGIPLAVIQDMVGHTSVAMTRHYTHLPFEMSLEAIKRLPSTECAVDKPEEEPPRATPTPSTPTIAPETGDKRLVAIKMLLEGNSKRSPFDDGLLALLEKLTSA